MADRRSSTIPKLTEEQKAIKKKAEAMLAKSENNWNKITPEQKEILNSPTSAFFYSIKRKKLNEINSKISGTNIGDLDEFGETVEFVKGKLFVNAADPNKLAWTATKRTEKSKNTIKKLNLLALSSCFTGTKDIFLKENKQIFTLGAFPPGITSYDEEYNLYEKNGDKNLSFFSEGEEAERFLISINRPEESIDRDCLFLISTPERMLFILFRTPKQAFEWSIALKILLKAQNLSYRGTKDEMPNKKKEFLKEIQKIGDVKLEPKDKNILFWIMDQEIDSYLYREVKIHLWSRNGESNIFFIFDMRKPISPQGDSLDILMRNETFLFRLLLSSYLVDLDIYRFFLVLQQDFDMSSEFKQMSFRDQKDAMMQTDHTEFWKTRRKIRKRFQVLVTKPEWDERKKNEEEERKAAKTARKRRRKKRNDHQIQTSVIEDRFDINCTEVKNIYKKLLESLKSQDEDKSDENPLLKALKVLQLQKQVIRSKLIRISTIRDKTNNKYRKQRAGRAIRSKEEKTTEKVAKKAYTAASNVLKIMMFEETIPGLIPEQIRNNISQEEKKRDGCCIIN